PAVEPSDVAYLLDTVNHYFPAARLVPADVVGAFAGLRPLVAPRGKATMSPSAVSREEEVFSSASGLISIAGGKLTTYRLVAKTVVDRVVDALRAAGDPRRFPRSRTREVPLPGDLARGRARLRRGRRGRAPPVAVKRAPARRPRRLNVARENAAARKARARAIARALARAYPDARCALDYRTPWELLVATILSAQ